MKYIFLYIGIFLLYFSITVVGNTKNNQIYFYRESNDFIYQGFSDWLIINFQENNYKNYFNDLCIRDCISFTFQMSESGDITIKNFSKFTPERIRKFLKESVYKLNALDIKKKPFISKWIEAKYFNRSIMQTIVLFLYNDTCKPTDLSDRGVLSMLTNQTDSGLTGVGLGQMNMFGGFNTHPFDGIILPPFRIQTQFR